MNQIIQYLTGLFTTNTKQVNSTPIENDTVIISPSKLKRERELFKDCEE